jgi:hypothetical protein
MLPLSRVSNRKWTTKLPGQAIVEADLTFPPVRDILERAFIDEDAFNALTSEHPEPQKFWSIRADLMVEYFRRKLSVRV